MCSGLGVLCVSACVHISLRPEAGLYYYLGTTGDSLQVILGPIEALGTQRIVSHTKAQRHEGSDRPAHTGSLWLRGFVRVDLGPGRRPGWANLRS